MGVMIRQVLVEGLFGDRRIEFDLPSEESLAFIHGPNGAGKSTVLRMLHAIYSDDFRELFKIPFERISVTHADGTHLTVTKSDFEVTRPIRRAGAEGLETTQGKRLTFQVSDAVWHVDHERGTSDTEVPMPLARAISSNLPFLTRTDYDQWEDDRTGQVFALDDVLESFAERLPSELLPFRGGEKPEAIRQATKSLKIQLISADRLAGRRLSTPRRRPGMDRFMPSSTVVSAVDEQRAQLSRTIKESAEDLGALSQDLDSSFSQRVLEQLNQEPVGIQELTDALNRNSDLRTKLEAVNLGSSGALPDHLSEKRMLDAFLEQQNDTAFAIFQLYLDDVGKKLARRQPLAQRMELFQRLVNEKLVRKSITFDTESGYVVRDQTDRELKSDQLSSGEQHELVLLYRLIFATDSQTVFLVDEPELSLHVEWQRALTRDLEAIAELGNIQFILATHSPVITGGRWDLMVDILPEYAE